MHLDPWTLLLQTVNFAILVWLLHRFLYKPVQRLIDARKSEIERQFAEARALQDKSKAEREVIEAQRAEMAAAREAALKSAQIQAQEIADARRVQAERDAQALLEETRKTLASERERALAEAQRLALELGAELAQRLLADVPLQLRAEAWLEHIEQHINALPQTDRDALVRQLSADTPLTVVAAVTLPPAITGAWQERLRKALGANVAVAFEANPDLIVGAELHFPTAVLQFSWQSALDAARAEVSPHANAH